MDEIAQARARPGAYVSESNYFEPRWQEAFWGANYPRLLAVKERYDPEGLFFMHHGVGQRALERRRLHPLGVTWGAGFGWQKAVTGRMRRKVRLTRGPQGRASFGMACFQNCCVRPRISSRLPEGSSIRTGFRSARCRCLRTSVRVAPRLRVAMVGVGPSSGSASLCKPTLSR